MSDITTGEFGGCPECGRADGFLNDGPDHWFICDTHLTKWLIGSNLFSAWRDLSDEEAAEQRDRLREYRQVDPFDPEPTQAEKRKQTEFEAKLESARKVDHGYGVVWENGEPHALGPDDCPF